MLGRDDKTVAKFRASLEAHRKGIELGGADWATIDSVFRLLDQKATSMLTYLAILLAGMSVMLVGGDTGAESNWLTVGLLSVLFATVFLSAFLCLSVAMIKLAPRDGKLNLEELPTLRMRDASGRLWRFKVAFWLTVVSSAGFAVLVFVRMITQYFLA